VVIGGRNSGTAAAIYLSKLCKTVYLIEQKSKLMCKQKYLDRLSLRKNIITVVNVKDINLIKKTKLQIKSISLTTPEKNIIIDLDYILVYIGLTPNSNLVNSICKLDKIGYIITDNHNETSCKGLFAAGDVTGRLSQIITCHGDGANAIYWIQKNIN
jgi:thioredoxin reductase